MDLSLAQQKALAILPKVSGGVSCISSALVVWIVLRDPDRRSLCYHRLICGISLVDLSASVWLAMSTWPIPSYYPTLWAVGNETTCRVQGFFTQFGVAGSFYNASLAIYFWLVVVRGWKEQQLQKIEWIFHAFPLLWALVSAVTGLVLDVYDNALLWCWVSPRYEKFRWGAFYGPLWNMILIVTGMCLAIYWHVRKLELAAEKHRSRLDEYANATTLVHQEARSEVVDTEAGADTANKENAAVVARMRRSFRRQASSGVGRRSIYQKSQRVKAVAHQCFLYAISFYINWAALSVRGKFFCRFLRQCACVMNCVSYHLFPQVTRLIETINDKVYYPLILIAAITVPMQGLPNFIIYLLPKLQRLRSRDPDAGWVNWFGKSMARKPPRPPRGNRKGSVRQFSSDHAEHNPSDVNDDVYDYDGEAADDEIPSVANVTDAETG